MKNHVIKENDTLETIAKCYKVSVKDIITDNDIKDRERLGVGNILKIREHVNNEKEEK